MGHSPSHPQLNLLRRLLRNRRFCRILRGPLRSLLLLCRSSIGARRDIRYHWLLRHDAVEGIFQHNAIAHQRVASHAIEFNPRLLVGRASRNEIAVRSRQIGLSLQNVEVGRSAERVLLLFGIEALLREFESLLGSFHLSAVLLYSELCLAHLNGDLVLQLLQLHLRLSKLELRAHLIGLRRTVPNWD